MEEKKWTPGPWAIARHGRAGKTFHVWRTDPGENLRNIGYFKVATHVTGEANANLIAASPELYDALDQCAADLAEEIAARYPKAVRDYPSESRKYTSDMQTVMRARTALAKARGET